MGERIENRTMKRAFIVFWTVKNVNSLLLFHSMILYTTVTPNLHGNMIQFEIYNRIK